MASIYEEILNQLRILDKRTRVLCCPDSGGGSVTADNGLNMSTATNVQLGGTLLQDTTIDTTDSLSLNITGSITGIGTAVVNITNTDLLGNPSSALIVTGSTGGGAAIETFTTNGSGIIVTDAGVAGVGIAIETLGGGTPFAAESDTRPSSFALITAVGTGITPAIHLSRDGALGSNGIGVSIEFATIDNTQNEYSGSIESSWASVVHATRNSQMDFYVVNSATKQHVLLLKSNGVINFPVSPPNFSNNAAAITGGLAVGDIYRNGDNLEIVH